MMTSLRNLSMPLRVLFSCFLLVLGIGYLAALAYLFLVDVEPHASKGQGVVEGIAEKYHGKPTLLETALQGAMSDRIGGPDKRRILQWVRAGAKADDFATVKPILDANCVGCHSANTNVQKKSGGPVPSFETYEGLSALADVDTGPTIAQLAKVSHVHLFGISIIFLLTGLHLRAQRDPVLVSDRAYRSALCRHPGRCRIMVAHEVGYVLRRGGHRRRGPDGFVPRVPDPDLALGNVDCRR